MENEALFIKAGLFFNQKPYRNAAGMAFTHLIRKILTITNCIARKTDGVV